MAVHAEDGHKQEVSPLEQLRPGAFHGQVPQQHQPGVLAVDLAGMDARLGQEGGFAGGLQGGRGKGPFRRGYDHPDVPPLVAFAQGDQVQLRRGLDQPLQPGHGLVVAGRGDQAGALGGREPGIIVRYNELLALAVPGQHRRQGGGPLILGVSGRPRRSHGEPWQ